MDSSTRIAEIHSFLAYVMEQWPTKREQVADELSRRCSKCILSENFSPLSDGVCAICRSGGPPRDSKNLQSEVVESQLAEILRSQAGAGSGSYDAVVLFSGGKDSAFLLHRLRTEFSGLRLVALTVDNGFMSSVALANCRSILAKLDGIDHFIFQPKKDLFTRTFRHAFTHLDGQGCYSKVDRLDGDLTFDIGRNFAATVGAPLLISGLSPEQVERILQLNGFESPRSIENQRRTRSADFSLEQIYSAEELDRYWWNPERWPEERRPRVLHPFHAWQYDEEFIPQEVVRLGLIEAGQDNPLVTNNDTIPVMLAVDSINLGYSSFEPEFAQLVREGRADRRIWLAMFEAIEYFVKHGQFLPQCISDTLHRLNLEPRDVGLPDFQCG